MVIAATWPILAIIAAGVALYALFANWGEITEWLGDMTVKAFNYIQVKFGRAGRLVGYPSGGKALSVGASLVGAIQRGIASAWDGLRSFFMSAWYDLVGSVPGLAGMLDSVFGTNNQGGVVMNKLKEFTKPGNGFQEELNREAATRAQGTQGGERIFNSESKEVVKTLNVKVDLDGREMQKTAYELAEEDMYRE